MQRLRAKASGVAPCQVLRPTDPAVVGVEQPDGTFILKETEARELFEPEAFVVTWEQALQLHVQRQAERRGKELAPSTVASIRKAFADLAATPADITTADIRKQIEQWRARGLGPTSIAQRCSLLQGVTESLCRQDLLKENVWRRVDTSAKSTKHIPEATPAQVAEIVATGDVELLVLLFLGLRIGELVSRKPAHLEGGWLAVCATDEWRLKTADSERQLPLPDHLTSLKLPTRGKTSINNRLKQISPELSAHSLRHAFRSACREAGIATEMAEHLMGHAQPGGSISSIYGSFSREAVRQAAERVWGVLDRWAGAK